MLLKLTQDDGEDIYVNMAHVIYVERYDLPDNKGQGSALFTRGSKQNGDRFRLYVKENPSLISKMLNPPRP